MESITVHAIQPSLFVCKLSVQVVENPCDLIVWSRGLTRAPGNDRLTNRWGKPLIRKLKQREWVEGALLDDSTAHLICRDVDAVPDDELIDLFHRFIPRRDIEVNIVRHGLGSAENYTQVYLPCPGWY